MSHAPAAANFSQLEVRVEGSGHFIGNFKPNSDVQVVIETPQGNYSVHFRIRNEGHQETRIEFDANGRSHRTVVPMQFVGEEAGVAEPVRAVPEPPRAAPEPARVPAPGNAPEPVRVAPSNSEAPPPAPTWVNPRIQRLAALARPHIPEHVRAAPDPARAALASPQAALAARKHWASNLSTLKNFMNPRSLGPAGPFRAQASGSQPTAASSSNAGPSRTTAAPRSRQAPYDRPASNTAPAAGGSSSRRHGLAYGREDDVMNGLGHRIIRRSPVPADDAARDGAASNAVAPRAAASFSPLPVPLAKWRNQRAIALRGLRSSPRDDETLVDGAAPGEEESDDELDVVVQREPRRPT